MLSSQERKKKKTANSFLPQPKKPESIVVNESHWSTHKHPDINNPGLNPSIHHSIHRIPPKMRDGPEPINIKSIRNIFSATSHG
jgi:hypothetical protein